MRTSALLLAFALAGCDLAGDGPRSLPPVDGRAAVAADTPAAFAQVRAAWEASGVRDYEFRYTRSCFCPPMEAQIRVEGGEMVEAWINGEPAPADPVQDLRTIDGLFELGEWAFENAGAVTAHVLPRQAPFVYSLAIDPIVEAADDEVGYVITGFKGAFPGEG